MRIITKSIINNEARKWNIPPAQLARLWLSKHALVNLAKVKDVPKVADNVILLDYKPAK